MIGLGIGIPLTRTTSGPTLGTTIATTHYNRVIADGGVLPVGVAGLGSVLDSVISAYGVTDSTDFNTKVPVFLDPSYTGYKLGAGSGTTLGQAVRTVYAISSSADVTQTTAASQPLLLAHSGVNYWWGSGVSQGVTGNHCSTPNASANQIIGDIEIIAKVDYVNNSAIQMMVTKSISASWQFDFYIGADNKLNIQYALNGAPNVAITKTSSVAISSPYSGWLKVTRNTSTGDVKFFTSSDNITYTQLGTTQSGTIGNLNSTTSIVYIGAYAASLSSSFNFQGKIYRATISNSIGGTPVVDFNPASYNAATSQTAWTSATGEVWTINTGTAATGYKGVLVDRTLCMGDGIDDTMQSGVMATKQYFTRFAALKRTSTASGQYVISGNPLENHLIYNAQPLVYNPPLQIVTSPASVTNILFALTCDFNGATSKTRLNAYSDVTGATGIVTSTIVNLFSSGVGSANASWFINTLIDSNAVLNDTQKTAMYNVLKTMNNNAF